MSGLRTIVGIGEALVDVFADSERIGGAPLNLAMMAHQLGNRGVIVSRVGQDRLGEAIFDTLNQRNMPTDHLQSDPDNATGIIYVETDGPEPRYDIVEHVAWDFLQWDGDLDSLAAHAQAVCFGTLAQRVAQSRNTIYRFVEAARRAVRLLDVNFRQDDFDRRELTRSLEIANALKVNEDELAQLRTMLLLPDGEAEAASQLMKTHGLDWVALTRGDRGTIVFTPEGSFEGDGAQAGTDGDPVGAGDATAAALLHGVVRRWDWPRTITLANALGAFVASQTGASPELTDEMKTLAGIEDE